MKTTLATAALTIMFLSAGAFAGIGHRMAPNAGFAHVNVTVIEKNSAWPVKGNITVETCNVDRCVDI